MVDFTGSARWLVLGGCLLAGAAQAQQVGLQLQGLATASRTLTAAELAKLPHQEVRAKDKDGAEHRYNGLALSALLPLAGAPQGKALHGPALTQALLVTGADKYQVVFALPELDPAFTSQTVLLADQRDGQPLPASHGPYQLIVPQDKRPTRWVRQVTGLRLVEVKP